MNNEIDQYIAKCPLAAQEHLNSIRDLIRSIAPEANESISYQIPTFKLHGNLVHFAAYKNHIGFYPIPSGLAQFQKELSIYKQGKGSVQFPMDKPMPLDLIEKIVRFRIKENTEKVLQNTKKGEVY